MTANYPSVEKRLPRAHFTRALETLCARLDAKSEADVSFLDVFWRHTRRTEHVRVKAVWAAGSYARGAADCGDLDLVVKVTGAFDAPCATLNATLLGKMPRVRPYFGTPEANGSRIAFPEAVLVWQPEFDWRAAIAGIALNPEASHFPRATDVVPFRLEQLRMPFEMVEELIAAHAAGIHRWRFTPLHHLAPVAPSERLGRWLQIVSSDKQRLGPYLQAYLDLEGASRDGGCGYSRNDDTWCVGDVCVALGGARPDVRLLDAPAVTRVAVLPRLCSRGPNGVWTIERGPNHLLNEQLERVAA